MQRFTIWTQTKGRASRPRQGLTYYDEQDAILAAGQIAIEGKAWVSVVAKDDAKEPNRWD